MAIRYRWRRFGLQEATLYLCPALECDDPCVAFFSCSADNYVHDMQDAGFAIMESMNADIHDNTVENVKYGVRISLGGSDNKIYDNVFDTCSSCEFTNNVFDDAATSCFPGHARSRFSISWCRPCSFSIEADAVG